MPMFDLPLDKLRAYRPERREPADFDAFWQRTLAEAAAFPLDAVFTPIDADLPLLFTLRTQAEGGERDVAPATYDAVLRAAASCCDAEPPVGDPTEVAIVLAARARAIERAAIERDNRASRRTPSTASASACRSAARTACST